MTDWWTASLKAQRDLLDAQKKALAAGEQALAIQETARKLAEANLATMQAWAKLWGMK